MDNKNKTSKWKEVVQFLLLPDFYIAEKVTKGKLVRRTFRNYFLKYLIWFLIGTVVFVLAEIVFAKFFSIWEIVALVVTDLLLSLLFGYFRYRHVKENEYFKEKYGRHGGQSKG